MILARTPEHHDTASAHSSRPAAFGLVTPAVARTGGVYVMITSHDEVLYVDLRGDVRLATTAVPLPNGLILASTSECLTLPIIATRRLVGFLSYRLGNSGSRSDLHRWMMVMPWELRAATAIWV